MLKCCIFDLDGTLLDTIKDLGVAMNYSLKKNGCLEYEIKEYYDFVGNGIKMLCKNALSKQGIDNEELLIKVYNDFKSYYSENYSVYSKVYQGLDEVIDYLKSNKIILGVYSNKEENLVKKIINLHFKEDIFSFVLGETNAYPRKPDVTHLNVLLNKLNIKPNECLYFGDSDVDMITAHNAGIEAIGVTWGFRCEKILIDNMADYIIHKTRDIIDLVKTKLEMI